MRTALYTIAILTLTAAIALTGMLWVHNSHTRRYQGHMWVHLWGTHGLHTVDLLALATELLLTALLLITLITGLSRRPK